MHTEASDVQTLEDYMKPGQGTGLTILIGLIAAIVITFGLFFVMQSLAAFDGEVDLREAPPLRFVDVVEDIEINPPQVKSREIEKPQVEAPPPPVDQIVADDAEVTPNAFAVSMPQASLNQGIDLARGDFGAMTDGEYLPLVRVQPQYPRRAELKHIEGYVLVQLTVERDGTVPRNSVEILEAKPAGFFEAAARKAAAKFKYKPKVVNGEPQAVTGVKYRFTFELEKLGGK